MLQQLRNVTQGTLDLLEFIAVLCALSIFTIAATSLLLATFKVAIRGCVLVLPFGGDDERRVELTELFVRRMTEMEQEWMTLARDIEALRTEINRSGSKRRSLPFRTQIAHPGDSMPLTSTGKLPLLPAYASSGGSGTSGPRTVGDELLANVVQLARVGALADADLGVISLAGVSFSPRDILALLRAAPAIVARRTLRGTIVSVAGAKLAWVEFEQRGVAGRRRRTQQAEIRDDQWLPAIEDLAFRLAKDRVYLVRDRVQRPHATHSRLRRSGREAPGPRSATVQQAVFESESWEACRLFLEGYAAHLRHYRQGLASDREQALELYEKALTYQHEFPRAAYNRAVMLYNRYLPDANDKAIDGFGAATVSRDKNLQPLAFAGLAMAHAQATHRFEQPRNAHVEFAREASERARALAPRLEEAVFVGGWVHQLDEHWNEAIAEYYSVVNLPGRSSAARRIKSFALNNAAWIMLHQLGEGESCGRAEALLWQALDLYPNKVAYANLGEIARRIGQRELAVQLYNEALTLDPSYANALNELAIIQLELAHRALDNRDGKDEQVWLEEAQANAEHAQRLAAADPCFAARLAAEYGTSQTACPVPSSQIHTVGKNT